MPVIQKVTDPEKKVTDPVLLKGLAKQGIDKDYVEFTQDYAPRSLGKGHSPYAKFYRDLKSNKRFMVVSGLPMVKPDGTMIEAGWVKQGNQYVSKANLFSAVTEGKRVTITCLGDQPTGVKEGNVLTYQPQLFIDGAELAVNPKPILLAIDPMNPNYQENTLEWDYGICKRRLRIIEGRIHGYWVFLSDPNGEVRVKYNQTGDFKLKLGSYKLNDEEVIPKLAFIENEYGQPREYPFEVSDSSTFYPDAHIENTSVDGRVFHTYATGAGVVWNSMRSAPGDTALDNETYTDLISISADWSGRDNLWRRIQRAIFLFDTSGLEDDALVEAAVFSLRGESKFDSLSASPDVNVYKSTPFSNTVLQPDDFVDIGTIALSSAISYSAWKTTSTFNDFALLDVDTDDFGYISRISITKLGTRNANKDVANVAPSWIASAYSKLVAYYSEQGAGFKPKLVVTFTVAVDVTIDAPLVVVSSEGLVPSMSLGLTLTGVFANGWAKRIKLTIDQNDIDATLTDFPILLHLSSSSGRNNDDVTAVFDEIGANRKKIRVETSGGTQCYVEIEKWDAGNEEAWLWVKVPSIASGADTELYLYYDSSKADNTDYVGDPNSTPAENVWDSNFKLVTHMRDDPDTSNIRDSTSNNNDGAKGAAGAPAVTTSGKIADAQDFDGTGDYINCGNDASLKRYNADFTVEAWIKLTSFPPSWVGAILSNRGGGGGSLFFVVGEANATYKRKVGFDAATGSDSKRFNYGPTELSLDTWYRVAITFRYDGGNNNLGKTFLNGGLETTNSSMSDILDPGATATWIGWEPGLPADYEWDGLIDEVRISNAVRTPAWIKASYESERDDLLDFGSEETAGVPSVAITSESLVPTFVLEPEILAPVVNIDSEALVPTLLRDVIFAVPAALVDSLAPVPTLSLGTTLLPPLVSIDSEALDALLSLGFTALPPTALIDAQSYIPTLLRDMIFAVPLVELDSLAPVPALSISPEIILAPLISIDSEAKVPTLSLDSILSAPLVAIDSEALAAALSLGLTVQSPLVAIDSQALNPTLALDMVLAIPVVLINSEALVPEVYILILKLQLAPYAYTRARRL